MATREPIPYHEQADLPRPSLEALFAKGKKISLFHWMVLALLEHGEPMWLEEIAIRLLEVGVQSRTGDMVHSLKKAWHGLNPISRTADGPMVLDTNDWKVRSIALETGLISYSRREPVQVDLPEQKPETEPLERDELELLISRGLPSSISSLRICAAVLDVEGRAMPWEEARDLAVGMGRVGGRWLSEQTIQGWRSSLVEQREGGVLALGDLPDEVMRMRRAVRKALQPHLKRQAEAEAQAERMKAARARAEERQAQQAREAAKLRRGLLHALPSMARPQVVVLLDLQERSLETFHCDALASVAQRLEGYDLMLGDGILDLLSALGCQPGRWRLMDLSPPRKTRKLNRAGRTLRITTELLLHASTGLSLGDPAKVASYLQDGDTRKLERRAEADAKALYAYYCYGQLHGFVRLRWGFLDERLPVEWSLPGEMGIYEILRDAAERDHDVQVVIGSSPGWKEPWARAKHASVERGGYGPMTVFVDELQDEVPLEQIQAVRIVGPRVTDGY